MTIAFEATPGTEQRLPVWEAASDEILIDAIKTGDEQAYAALIHRYVPRSNALARRLLQDAAAAEDVVQEAFLQVWLRRDRWQTNGRAKFSTWLYRVVVNRCLDLRRKKTGVGLDEAPEPIDESASAETLIQARQVNRRVHQALTTLSARQYLAITLQYFEGCSSADAAEIMSISVNAYDSLLKRARQCLRAELKKSATDVRDSFRGD